MDGNNMQLLFFKILNNMYQDTLNLYLHSFNTLIYTD